MKKLLSLLLALAMVISMVPSVFATEEEGGAAVDTGVSGGTDVGLWADAEITDLGTMDTTLVAGDADGYIYSWTADATGNVSFTGETEDETAAFDIIVYCGDAVVYLSESEDNTASVDVVAGDKVYVQIVALPDENGAFPGMVVSAWGSFTYPAGSQQNPIATEFVWNDEQTEATATVIAPVGTTYYSVRGAGMLLSINGGEPIAVTGNMWNPFVFTITNDGEAEAEYTLKLWVPVGTMDNPEALTLGWNEVSLEANNSQGYYYSWIAQDTGVLTAYFGTITEGVEADIVINNNTTYVNKTLLADGVDNYGLEVSMDVNKGDEIAIQIVVLPDAEWKYPAADISWNSTLTYPAGSQQNPIAPEFAWNDEYTEATATVIAPAGTTTYFAISNGGMMLSIDGGEPFVVQASMWAGPHIISITNETEEDAEHTLKLWVPVGTMDNPDTLVIGENTADIAAGAQGYFYTWIAEKDGTLTITMPDGNWTYALNNMTTGVYGDTQWSDSDPVVKTASIEVKAGDEIQLVVNTYDPANPWSNPAGKLVITAAFAEPEPEIPPVEITAQPQDSNSIVGEYAYFTVELNNEEGVKYQWYLSQDGGSTFAKATQTGNKTKTLSLKVYENRAGMWVVYCEITDADGNILKTNTAAMTLKASNIKLGWNNTADKEVVLNRGTTLAARISSNPEGVTYLWQEYRDGSWIGLQYLQGGSGPVPADGRAAVAIVMNSARDGSLFRCKFTDVDGTFVYSPAVALHMAKNPMSIATQAQDVGAVLNMDAVFHFKVEGFTNTVTYKWYYSNNGGETWGATGLKGYNSDTLYVKAYASREGYMYYCVATDGVGHKMESAKVTLNLLENPLSVVSQPTSAKVAVNETAVFNFAVEGNVGDVSYQWYFRKPGGSWGKVSAADGKTDTLSVLGAAYKSGYQYYCTATDSVGNVITSDTVTLTVE